MARGPRAHHFLFILSLTCIASRAFGDSPLSQLDSMIAYHGTNKSGSDQSLQSSTTNAMRALMELANQNRSGAISNGYKAFGQYRNAGDLDNLRMKNSVSALSMDSFGSAIKKDSRAGVFLAPLSDYETSYRRLDPKFLRQGEAGKVAEQFEKATGMSRETFLKKMVSASDGKIQVNDPKLVDKVLSRFEEFVKEIPNDDFRKKVEGEIAAVPQTMRTGIISQAVQKFTVMFAGASVSPNVSDIAVLSKDSKASQSVAAADTPKTESTAPVTSDTPAAMTAHSPDDRGIASLSATRPALVGRPEYRGIDFERLGSDGVGGVIQSAIDDQREDTIFKQVSRKYRSLSATLRQQPI